MSSSSDKRRRARVQGGWAAPQRPKKSSASSSAPSEPEKSRIYEGQAWMGKIVDQPTTGKKFIYREPEEEIRVKPPDKVITKPGVYDISESEIGTSRLRFFPEFIESKEADWFYDQFYQDLPWRQRSDVKNGESYLQPRLTAWFGEHPYSYSGVTHDKNSEMTPALRHLKARLEEATGYKFNSVLANLYRDGHDHVPWHSDDEKSLRSQPTIASLSFGDTRNFELRKKAPPGEDANYEYAQHVSMPLNQGSLLIMEGAVQEDWQHRIPREYHDRGPRINLTFRIIYPD
ncbi:alpha-ketoglutarate-dependent dioxygenase alkB homolog 3-like [Liolophura sinensis]|uniref:alpha-ketoglutarate-dependent dioxygenase alkB homolog 3-like n=1 Tax=Liolophura sinensis TaxID=3198878 RepID=UPI003158FAE2